jgi:hypothetical protein
MLSSTVSVASQVLTKLAEVTMTERMVLFFKGHRTNKPVHERTSCRFLK